MGFSFSVELTRKLKELSWQEGSTLFMTLVAAYQVLLARYSGQDDITIGTPIAGRTRPELEPLIGFFVNVLVLRGDLSGRPSFRKLLKRVREVTLGAYAHQEVPFEKLVEDLQPERDWSRSPFFQVMLALQNVPGSELSLPGLDLQWHDVESDVSKFDLTMNFAEEGGKLFGLVEYDLELFSREYIGRLIGHWQQLLSAIVETPEACIADLPLMSEAERSNCCSIRVLHGAYLQSAGPFMDCSKSRLSCVRNLCALLWR